MPELRSSPARLAGLAVLFLTVALSGNAAAQVFVNEIHYDNAGTDTGEAIELAGAAGTDLTGWSLVLYNGSTGSVYDTAALSGTIADQQGGLGTVVVNYPTNGIQNGGPDGIALVDAASNVVQFLSYEGTFTAIGGPADGLTSIDIGVAEASDTAIGDSLQLTGSGSFYANFSWAGPQPSSFGAPNTGQVFGGGEPPAPVLVINEIDYDQPGSDAAEFVEILNAGGNPVDLSAYALTLVNGATGAPYATIALPAVSLAPGAYFVVCGQAATTANCNLDVTPDSNLLQNGSPDAVALTRSGDVVDAVSYEGDIGAPYSEGTGTSVADDNATPFLGLSRAPDGTDSNDNAADFALRCITPGEANGSESANCPDPQAGPPLVINEIHADPDSSLGGDANNDGTRDSGGDEFVELVNVSGADLDVSGWTLADGVGPRHVFPAGTVVGADCAIVVFGGGAPAGTFGGALVQTASEGALGLNNGGDSVVLSDPGGVVADTAYGSEGGNNQSLTLVPDVTGTPPYVLHTAAPGSNGALFSPGTRADGGLFDGCEAPDSGPFEIHEIQGAGEASPYAGQSVTTLANVVTALAPDGFFMQTPADRSDGSRDTSDGIFVFLGGAPAVTVGDLVDVTGTVVEFFGFTELSNNPEVTVVGAGAALPPPVDFDASVPSPDPAAPSCAIEYECYEGMLVELADGRVTGSNQSFGSDPVAEVYVSAAGERAFREPGIEFPGLAGLPVWDGNPEVFELDPDKLGLPNRMIPAGSGFSARGVLGFEFGGYELWPSELHVTEAPLGTAVRHPRLFEITVGSLNLFRLFDDVDDAPTADALGNPIDDEVVSTEEYRLRLAKAADYIVDGMRSPDIIALQEVEKLGVLEDLAAEIDARNPFPRYRAFLEEGNDIGAIDVGFLVRDGVRVESVTQIAATETFVEPDGDVDLLHDRPPLLLEAQLLGGRFWLRDLYVIAVHNRSLGGIDGSDGERVRLKRLLQAQSIAGAVEDLQTAEPHAGIVVTGDFNAFEFTDGYVDVVGQVRGDVEPADNLLSGPELVDPVLLNQLQSLPPEERYSFVFDGSAQVLDHALTNQALDFRSRGLEYARGNADAAEILIEDGTTAARASDHDGLVLYLYRGPAWLAPWLGRLEQGNLR